MEDIRPENYRIHLIPDLTQFSFSGHVTLLVEAPAAIGALRLNVLDLEISDCAVEQNDDWIECKFETDEKKEELQILLPKKMEGAIRVQIRYEGQINDRTKPSISL
jgi:hypothetical protein